MGGNCNTLRLWKRKKKVRKKQTKNKEIFMNRVQDCGEEWRLHRTKSSFHEGMDSELQ